MVNGKIVVDKVVATVDGNLSIFREKLQQVEE